MRRLSRFLSSSTTVDLKNYSVSNVAYKPQLEDAAAAAAVVVVVNIIVVDRAFSKI